MLGCGRKTIYILIVDILYIYKHQLLLEKNVFFFWLWFDLSVSFQRIKLKNSKDKVFSKSFIGALVGTITYPPPKGIFQWWFSGFPNFGGICYCSSLGYFLDFHPWYLKNSQNQCQNHFSSKVTKHSLTQWIAPLIGVDQEDHSEAEFEGNGIPRLFFCEAWKGFVYFWKLVVFCFFQSSCRSSWTMWWWKKDIIWVICFFFYKNLVLKTFRRGVFGIPCKCKNCLSKYTKTEVRYFRWMNDDQWAYAIISNTILWFLLRRGWQLRCVAMENSHACKLTTRWREKPKWEQSSPHDSHEACVCGF